MLLGPGGTSSWLSCQEVSSAPELMRAAHSSPSSTDSLTHSWECWEEAAVLALAPGELCHGSKHPVFLPVCLMLEVLGAAVQDLRRCRRDRGVRQLQPQRCQGWDEPCQDRATVVARAVSRWQSWLRAQQQIPFLHQDPRYPMVARAHQRSRGAAGVALTGPSLQVKVTEECSQYEFENYMRQQLLLAEEKNTLHEAKSFLQKRQFGNIPPVRRLGHDAQPMNPLDAAILAQRYLRK